MKNFLKKLIRTLLPILVVALAVFGAVVLYKTRPRPQPKEMHEYAAQAVVETLQKTAHIVRLNTTGTVVPAREITLQARVSGEVLSMNGAFLPGGRIAAGEPVLSLDPVDYELSLDLSRSEVEQAKLALAQEEGMQEVARHEWELIDSREDLPELQKELILRKPHLEAAQAVLASAEAAQRQAEINLERTKVIAPFDAVVLSKSVDVGAQVTAQTTLGQLAGTDEYWVETTLPARDLKWIKLPAASGEAGAPVHIRVRDNGEWEGYVKKLDAQLEDKGRLAQLLVAIPDPLAPSGDRMPLILGSHVEVEIEGIRLEDVFVLPRSAYHDGESVWIMNADSRLEIRPVEPVWANADWLVIRDGLQEGEQLVVSDLAVPAPNQLLAVGPAANEAPEE